MAMTKPTWAAIGLCMCCLLAHTPLFAQLSQEMGPVRHMRVEANAPLPVAERQLMPIARFLLSSPDSLTSPELHYMRKLAANDLMVAALNTLLRRPESYDYPFDSLITLSRLAPADNSFRIFTWVVRDSIGVSHYHGFVQRRVPRADKQAGYDIRVIRLEDKILPSNDIETLRLNNSNWLGALYYKPRNTSHGVLSYPSEFYQVDGYTGKMRTQKTNFYVVLGLNEQDRKTNFKVIEVISFDDRYPDKVFFGAPILFFTQIPRHRALFRYADNAHFTLNVAEVLTGKSESKREPMIVFDHLADPGRSEKNVGQLFAYGADGSVDALQYVKRLVELRKGLLALRKDVVVYEPKMLKYDPKFQRQRAADEQRKMRKAGLDMNAAKK